MKLLALALALCLVAGAAHAQAVAGRPHLFMATAVGGTANAPTITTGGGFNNTAMDIVCANFTTPNTGNATVAVDGKAALPVQTQIPGALSPLGGNELTGYQCLQVNVGATSFVLGGVHGGVTVNPAAHTITAGEWTYGQTFVCNIAGCNLTFPAVNTLSGQGGVSIATVGVQATLTPNSADQINGGQIGGSAAAGGAVTFPADLQSFVVSTGANALSVPMGPVQILPFSWLPGMDLSLATNGFGVGRAPSVRIVYAIACENDVVAAAASSMQFYQQTASGLIGAGTTMGNPFNMFTSAAGTESANLLPTPPGPIVVPANYWIGAKVTGAPGVTGAGRCNVSFR
jgi:hypothetical protein